MKLRVLGVVALVAVAGVGEAQIVAPAQLLPVVAKVAGAQGTDWVTTVSVSNVSDSTTQVTAMFFREATANNPLFGVPTHQVTLGAGETVTVDDVLGDWFPTQGNSKGTLLLFTGSLDDLESGAEIAATARVFNNANPAATYGQSVSSNPASVVMGRGVSVLSGVRHDAATRSNIGVVNLAARPVTFVITVYSSSGAVLAEASRTVEMMSMGQWSLGDLGAPSISEPGRVEVRIDPASITWDPCDTEDPSPGSLIGLFMTYVSKVDGATGDAEFAYGLSDWADQEAECGEVPGDC